QDDPGGRRHRLQEQERGENCAEGRGRLQGLIAGCEAAARALRCPTMRRRRARTRNPRTLSKDVCPLMARVLLPWPRRAGFDNARGALKLRASSTTERRGSSASTHQLPSLQRITLEASYYASFRVECGSHRGRSLFRDTSGTQNGR